jgi:acyl carrier protein
MTEMSSMDGSLKDLTRDEILVRVRALMAERFEVDPARVALETRLVEDLDLDSIDAIDMAVELQGWTGVPLAEEALRAVRTVDDVITMIEAHLAKVAAARGAEAALGSDAATETSGRATEAPRAPSLATDRPIREEATSQGGAGTATATSANANANANEGAVGSVPAGAASGHGAGGAGPVTG